MERPSFRRHVPALDGLRGVAVALVVVYHFAAGWPYWAAMPTVVAGQLLRAGWIGVDVFFVLSGYLITGILADARDAPHRYRTFMTRRALRIFPAYYAMLLVDFALVPRVEHALGVRGLLERNGLANTWPWFVAYLSNVRQLHGPEYPISLSVTWSLGVEEQFYLLWPWLVWYAKPTHLRRWIVVAIVFGECAKLAWYATTHNAIGLRYLTPCCVDEFAWGALVAVLLREAAFDQALWHRLRTWGLRVALPAAFVLVLPHRRLHPLLEASLLSLTLGAAGAALIVASLDPRPSRYRAVTESRPLRAVGRYSYAIYLTHALFVPWLGVAGRGVRALHRGDVVAHLAAFGLYLALTGAASVVLHRAVERPMLALRSRASARSVPR